MASITPEARAAASVTPLPWESDSERELGRHTITTGMPMQSRPVTSATRVIPNGLKCRDIRMNVSSAERVRSLRCLSLIVGMGATVERRARAPGTRSTHVPDSLDVS